MTALTENALPIWVAGGLLGIFAAIVFASRRDVKSLVFLAATVAITLSLAMVERLVVTDREQIETSVYAVTDAIEANDLQGALQWVDPAAAVRSDVEALMPMVQVEKANVGGSLPVEIDPNDPGRAATRFRAFFNATSRRGGFRIAYFDDVEIAWRKSGDRWLIDDYVVYFKGRPINAVDSARSNRPVGAN